MSLFTLPRARAGLLPNALVSILLVGILISLLGARYACAVAPTIDYSHNMRILKLPKSLRTGELVYRLKGSDGDPNTQLHFGVSGAEGRALLDVLPVPNSWNEADVYLRSALISSDDPAAANNNNNFHLPVFNLTVFVSDGNKSTQVESTLIVTNDDELETNQASDFGELPLLSFAGNRSQASSYSTSGNISTNSLQTAPASHHQHQRSAILLSPFIRPRHVFSVPESAAPGETIGWLSVRESDQSDLPVRFELRGKGADFFAIRYVFGPRGQSRGELLLAQPVDYERQNLFSLKVLALNAWTNARYDTRNVATLDVVITVGDVQDTAPQWRELPTPHLRVSNLAKPGDLLARVRAEDGDFGDQRPIQYALDASSQLALSNYFSIDIKTGVIQLTRPFKELAQVVQDSRLHGDPIALVIFASEVPDASSFEHLWPPMFARAELPLLLVDELNEAPRFVGGWQTAAHIVSGGVPSQQQATSVLHGYLPELPTREQALEADASGNSAANLNLNHHHQTSTSGHLVQWYVNTSASDDDQTNSDDPTRRHETVGGRPMAIDLNVGLNGTFELSLEGPDAHLFELEPNYPVQQRSLFNLMVAQRVNRSLFDADTADGAQPLDSSSGLNGLGSNQAPRVFQVDVVARDFGSPKRLSARIRCLIELLDLNDNAPQFEEDLYTFQVYENAPPGQVLGSVRARDLDANSGASSRNQLIGGPSHQRIHYVSLTGFDAHLFKLDPISGLVTLAGQLDRERQATYLLVAEARDQASGPMAPSNYTKIMINVLDVNDNAPVFSQSHYDAVLLADGTFHQPLVVSARDLDEPQSANSQVAYEIIAGNQNDQFAIDALSGLIYPTSLGPPPLGGANSLTNERGGQYNPTGPVQLPPILSEPILPFGVTANSPPPPPPPQRRPQLDQHGRIRPALEVEETTLPAQRNPNSNLPYIGNRLSLSGHLNPRSSWSAGASEQQVDAGAGAGSATPSLASAPEGPLSNFGLEQLPSAFELLLNSADAQPEAGARHVARSAPPTSGQSTTQASLPVDSAPVFHSHQHAAQPSAAGQFDPFKVAPLTQLVVRAHDFGIPLRSSTCKVNIHNQALLSRSLSVILNGTAEQLEQRREAIERAFGSLTASKAQIESLDALSDSSSICVARLKLTIPAGHSLIDLTDLTALMQALDYKPSALQQQHPPEHHHLPIGSGGAPATHYIAAGDRLYPIQAQAHSNISAATPPSSSNSQAPPGAPNPNAPPAFYTDFNQFSLDSNLLERKLLFYIIVVGICILALLVIWMIYFCCRETDYNSHGRHEAARHRHRKQRHLSSDSSVDQTNEQANKLKGRNYKHKSVSKTHLIEEEAAADELEETRAGERGVKTHAKTMVASQSAIGNNLAKGRANSNEQAQELANSQGQSTNRLMTPGAHLTSGKQASDHYSMYNGQVWFEQGGLRVRPPMLATNHQRAPPGGGRFERRASSAPSASNAQDSLDSSLRAAIRRQEAMAFGRSPGGSLLSPASSAIMLHPMGGGGGRGGNEQRGRFFPNTIGYMENLAAIGGGEQTNGTRRIHRGGRVAPMSLAPNGATIESGKQALDLESGGSGLATTTGGQELRRQRNQAGRRSSSRARRTEADGESLSTSRSLSCNSSNSASTSAATRTLGADSHESVLLDSDQELLGFDSTGTPIIATHTRRRSSATGGPGASTIAQKSLLLSSDLTSGGRDGASSPAPTVVKTNASKRRAKGEQEADIEETREVTRGALKRPEVQSNQVDGVAGGPSAINPQRTASATDARVVELMDRKGSATDEQQQQGKTTSESKREQGEVMESEVASQDGGEQGNLGELSARAREGATVAVAASQTKATDDNRTATMKRSEKSLDLMGELNAKLASNNQRQRALRRQSADERDSQAAGVAASGTSGFLPPLGPLTSGAERVVSSARVASGRELDKKTSLSRERQTSATSGSLSCQSSISSVETTIGATNESGGSGAQLTSAGGESATKTSSGGAAAALRDMKNGELLEKQSIFALTYSGLATDKLPS